MTSAAQTSCQQDARLAYNILIATVIAAQDTKVVVKLFALNGILSLHPLLKTCDPFAETNSLLSQLVRLFGETTVNQQQQLVLKSMLATWITTICAIPDTDEVTLQIGFYAPPSIIVYNDFCHKNLLPAFLLQAMHRIETSVSKLRLRPNVQRPPFHDPLLQS